MIIGDGDLSDVCLQLIKSLGLNESVFLLGAMDRSEIMKKLGEAFLFVQHSVVASDGDSEGTPVGILEAMASGLPVVSTRHAGIPDVVQHGETGFLVDEGNIKDMSHQIEVIVKDRDMAKQFGINGRLRISRTFNMSSHIQTINDQIKSILNDI